MNQEESEKGLSMMTTYKILSIGDLCKLVKNLREKYNEEEVYHLLSVFLYIRLRQYIKKNMFR